MIDLSSNTFDISEYYRARLPRGKSVPPDQVLWATGSILDLIVTPNTTPENYVMWISELWFLNTNVQFTETQAGNGLIDISYPDEDGALVDLLTIDSMADLDWLCDKNVTVGSVTYKVMTFDPPKIMFASKTENTFKITKNTNVTAITSGSLQMILKNIWTLKESNY